MAASDHIQGLYDVALKPQLLRSLLLDYVPTEKHPFRSPSDLSHVVSVVKTHRLLSESAPPSAGQKIIEIWKSAVDDWVKRLLNLASSSMPDKCWAGICLLGVTCQECSSARFFASYPSWFLKLLSHIQSPADSHLVKAASCASVSDLFSRLSGFTNAKKDATSQATKVIQPVLKLLNEDTSIVLWEEAVSLLCTLINLFPSSVQRCYDEVESAVFSNFMSGKCSQVMLRKLGDCLVLLPKSKGDEDSWLLMMHKILRFINIQLNDVFQGLEPETRHNEAMRLLLPPGKDTPPPLGGQDTPRKISSENMNRSEHMLISRISILMLCCSTMLSSPYTVQVAVPVCALVDLSKRVLMVDGSASALYAFMTTMKQELILSELPLLHMCSLELIIVLVKELHSQLLPYAGGIVRLLVEYFQICALPELRIKLYSVTKVLLLSMGVGISAHLAQVIMDSALSDLDGGGTSLGDHAKIYVEAQTITSKKKRKHTNTAASHENQPDGNVMEVKMQNSTLISLKIAALEVLEAFLTVGGSWKFGDLRSKVDDLILAVATSACRVRLSKVESSVYLPETPIGNSSSFQLAALHALLASLLSPCLVRLPDAPQCTVPVRPPHLAQGFELFRRGVQETGTRLSQFCTHALLTLEVLIHPRALPLFNHQSFNGQYQRLTDHMKLGSGGGRQEVLSDLHKVSQNGPKEQHESEYDDLHERWMKIDDEDEDDDATQEAPSPSDVTKDKSNTIKPSDSSNDHLLCLKSGAKVTVDQKHTQEPIEERQVENADHARVGASVPLETDAQSKNTGLMECLLPNNISSSISFSDSRLKGFMQESDDDSDSIPDIVDVEPDDDDLESDD
ncbi:hypothetical protein DM860_009425 [Cuscuta australis]|uniref:Pre-rRNA-processing protein RIX1 N-terminal domain-containing protein n=1 Tax=Cuscuta australis TaxID=267555 RepID=A0A328DMX8_9ASTE|nr:hypothetical protein DM860_009425 [Cuscuta australis]